MSLRSNTTVFPVNMTKMTKKLIEKKPNKRFWRRQKLHKAGGVLTRPIVVWKTNYIGIRMSISL